MAIACQLEELMHQAQHAADTEVRWSALTALVDISLRSRRVGRAPRGHPLTGIYRAIYERVRQQFLTDLERALQRDRRRPDSIEQWLRALQIQACRKSLADDQLKQLALEAQSHPPQSPGRQHALIQLVEAIHLSGRLARPHRAKFTPQFYALLYEEAMNRTLAYVCRHIDQYDPERGRDQKFMSWVNFRLDRMMIECRRQFSDRQVQTLPDLEVLNHWVQSEPNDSLADQVRDCLIRDPDQLFQTTHIRNRPDANFRAIALARLAGQRWEEIATDLSIKVPTLNSFFQRCCSKFAPKFQDYV